MTFVMFAIELISERSRSKQSIARRSFPVTNYDYVFEIILREESLQKGLKGRMNAAFPALCEQVSTNV